MNSQDIFVAAKRLKTFFGMPNIPACDKLELVMNGFYADPKNNKVKCIRCTEMFIITRESIPTIRRHNCNRAFNNNFQKEPVPYLSTSPNIGDDLYYEEFRVGTFLQWEYKDETTIKALAKSGFYLTLNENTIRCCYCKFSLCEASKGGANATRAHLTFHPECLINKSVKDKAIKTTFQKQYPNIVTHSEIDDLCKLMDSTLIEKAMEMGFTDTDIRSSIENRKQLGLSSFDNMEQLLEALTLSGTQQLQTSTPKKPEAPERTTCSICMDNDSDTAFVPCGHFVTCNGCARNCTDCPICRKNISSYMKIYT